MVRIFNSRQSAFAGPVVVALLSGCAGVQDVVVKVPEHKASGAGALGAVPPRQVSVEPFSAKRGTGQIPGRIGERTAADMTSMGFVTVSPLPEELLTRAIARELQAAGHSVTANGASRITGTVDSFALRTPGNLAYWDVIIDIGLSLKVNARAVSYRESCTQRTAVWPSEKLIGDLAQTCIARIAKKFQEDRNVASAL